MVKDQRVWVWIAALFIAEMLGQGLVWWSTGGDPAWYQLATGAAVAALLVGGAFFVDTTRRQRSSQTR